MSLKKYIIYSVSTVCILALATYAVSCIWEPVYYNYPSFFGNKAPGKTAYRPFFYIGDDLYYDNGADRNQDNTDLLNDANIKEWRAFAGPAIALNDIDSVVNKFSIKDVQKGGGKNSFVHWLHNDKTGEAIDYLVYAKQCEPYVSSESYWDTLKVNRDSSEILINKGLAACAKVKADFIRMRYAFQVLRLAFYTKQNDRTLNLYSKLIGNKQDTSLAYARCLGFKAGVYFRQSSYAQAAYLYSRMFEICDGLKPTAMISFNWCVSNTEAVDGVLAAALNLCKNNHERAVITVIHALREYAEALPDIKKAYELDPTVEGIDVLVNREINKVEERYQAHYINKMNGIAYDSYVQYFEDAPEGKQELMADSVRKTYPAYLKKINDFTRRMIQDKKNSSVAFWYLSSAYIQYMLHNTEQVQANMQLAGNTATTNQEKQLYQVLTILYSIQHQPNITPAFENELLPKLQALEKLAAGSSDQENNFVNIMSYLLAPKYLQQKDTIKALYCMAHYQMRIDGVRVTYSADDSYEDRPGEILNKMSLESLHKVQAFEANTGKTPFEAWLVANTSYTGATLAELEGTKYLREFNFKAAEKIFQNIPNLESLPYPFEMRINDYEDTVYRQDKTVLTNKYTFAKQMADLQDTIALKPNSAPALYKYALGLYSMSYYGRASHLFTYYHHSWDESKYFKTKERDKLPAVFQEYYGVYTAEKYFNMAEKAAINATLKAKCVFGAAKCWQKRCPSKGDEGYDDESYVTYSLSNPYFKTLKRTYGTNEFTKEVYSTCSYYRDYVKKN